MVIKSSVKVLCNKYKYHSFSSFKIWNKIQNLKKTLKLIQGGIEKIPPHHTYQIYHSPCPCEMIALHQNVANQNMQYNKHNTWYIFIG